MSDYGPSPWEVKAGRRLDIQSQPGRFHSAFHSLGSTVRTCLRNQQIKTNIEGNDEQKNACSLCSLPTTAKNRTRATDTEPFLLKKKHLGILGAFMEGNNYPEAKTAAPLRPSRVSVSPQSPFLLSLLSFNCPHLTLPTAYT